MQDYGFHLCPRGLRRRFWFARLHAKGKGEETGKDSCFHHLEPSNRVGIFLQKVIDDQEKEIELMKKWRGEWYPGKPSALNMEMPGMKMSSHAVAAEFNDLEYIDMMIPHHEGAVLMAKEALQKAEHDEVKKLASAIIDAQESEIKKMKEWKEEWSK